MEFLYQIEIIEEQLSNQIFWKLVGGNPFFPDYFFLIESNGEMSLCEVWFPAMRMQ